MSNQVVVNKLEEERQARRLTGLNNPREIQKILSIRKPRRDVRLKDLNIHVTDIMSDDPRTQLQSTRFFRQLLSLEHHPPIQNVIDSGVVPRLVQFLRCSNNPHLQFEACWALTNIASGTTQHTQVVLQHGAVPLFIALLDSPDENVAEQAVWAIGNVSGDSPQCRDYILSLGAVKPMIKALESSKKLSMVRNAVWTISNFCRGKPAPNFDYVAPLIPALSRLLYVADDEVLTDCLWAFSYLSEGTNDHIQHVIEAGVARRIVELCGSPKSSVQTPALRTLGNIVTGNDQQTQIMLNVGALPALKCLLTSTRKATRKEALWTVSNITAGSATQIQSVIESGVIPQVVQYLDSGEFDVRKEACWAISNATSCGKKEQIKYLVDSGCIPPLCRILEMGDARISKTALEGLTNIAKSLPEHIDLLRDIPEHLAAIMNCKSQGMQIDVSALLELLGVAEPAGDDDEEAAGEKNDNFSYSF